MNHVILAGPPQIDRELEAKVSFKLTVQSTDLQGGEIKLIKAVDIQGVFLLSIRFKLCAPKGTDRVRRKGSGRSLRKTGIWCYFLPQQFTG